MRFLPFHIPPGVPSYHLSLFTCCSPPPTSLFSLITYHFSHLTSFLFLSPLASHRSLFTVPPFPIHQSAILNPHSFPPRSHRPKEQQEYHYPEQAENQGTDEQHIEDRKNVLGNLPPTDVRLDSPPATIVAPIVTERKQFPD